MGTGKGVPVAKALPVGSGLRRRGRCLLRAWGRPVLGVWFLLVSPGFTLPGSMQDSSAPSSAAVRGGHRPASDAECPGTGLEGSTQEPAYPGLGVGRPGLRVRTQAHTHRCVGRL